MGHSFLPKNDSNMKETTLEEIKKVVEESKRFPNSTIEYSCELPKHKQIKPDSFFGVPAVYNERTNGVKLIFKY